MWPLLSIVCPGDAGGETFGPGLPGARLRVFARGRPASSRCRSTPTVPAPGSSTKPRTQEVRDGIEILRFVEGSAPGNTFTYDPLLRTATLVPPAPFSGDANFHRDAAPVNRWTGDLAIDFPGRSDVHLAGSALRAGLVHAHLNP